MYDIGGFFVLLLATEGQYNIFVAVVLFSLLHGALSLVSSTSQSQYLKSIKDQSKSATILSAVALLSRIFGIIALMILALFVTNKNLSLFFAVTSIFFCVIAALFLKWKTTLIKHPQELHQGEKNEYN